jgi:LAO/AO transport system kinase
MIPNGVRNSKEILKMGREKEILLHEIARGVIKGDRLAISKAISVLENHEKLSDVLLQEIYPSTGRAFVLGVTGPPGTGKSSLVDRLVRIYRSRGRKVGILAVDPTSPITGGAILGDRVRMLEHSLDSGVYIRSMASRGDPGGLSKATKNAVRVLDAAANDVVIVETVGIGQAEVEVVEVADGVLVVLMPELGDEIQANKAGIVEIGDIFVVNKADLLGADKLVYNIESVLAEKNGWHQKALKVSAKTGQGFDELAKYIDELESFSRSTRSELKKEQLRKISDELVEMISESVMEKLRYDLENNEEFGAMVEKIAKRELDPQTASKKLLSKLDYSRKRS